MNSKIILIHYGLYNTPIEETLIATFKNDVEAFQAASLFQAMVKSENYCYYVEHHVKGKGIIRTQPDNFNSWVSNSTNLYSKLKPIFKAPEEPGQSFFRENGKI